MNLIGAETTKEAPRIESRLDKNLHELEPKVSDTELMRLPIERAAGHGEWSCTLVPRPLSDEVMLCGMPSTGSTKLRLALVFV